MTVIEAAKVLGVKVRTIRSWISAGKLPAKKVGRELIIPDDSVYSKEVQDRANEGRKYSRRVEGCKTMGMLARGGEDTEESIQREECKK